MTKRLAAAAVEDFAAVMEQLPGIAASTQEVAQGFVDRLYERCSEAVVLLRLFITVRYDQLPQEDRLFVDGRGRATNTIHLIDAATPIFTLFGSRGLTPEWNDRRVSAHFRCIPLASSAFVASLSMLSRQFESVGLDPGLIDVWETAVVSTGRADQFRGRLYIRDAATDRDLQGRLIVPKQDFVKEYGVKSVFGFGSGYRNYPALVTLFAFTDKELAEDSLAPFTGLLDAFVAATAPLAGQERFFAEK
jgi:hypothetical protein